MKIYSNDTKIIIGDLIQKEVEIEILNSDGSGSYIYINENQAEEIMAHLSKILKPDTPELISGTYDALNKLSVRGE